MSSEVKICTFNVRNDNLVKNLTEELIEDCYSTILKKYKVDILTTQEMIDSTLDVLKKKFTTYYFVGKGRYGTGSFQKRINLLKKYNEHASIITNFKVLSQKTNSLPWLPRNMKDFYNGIFKYHSMTPRVLTDIVIEIGAGKRICILNTHLDCHMNTVRKRQLNYIIKYVKKLKIPVILLGDFNSNLTNKAFLNFIKELETLGLKRVEYNHKTFRKSKKDTPIDHIFLSKELEVKEYGIIEEKVLERYSDHFPLYATIIIK